MPSTVSGAHEAFHKSLPNAHMQEILDGFEIYLDYRDKCFMSSLNLFFSFKKVGYMRIQKQKEKKEIQ